MMGTDQDWEKWGATDPYYGVYSSAQYRTENLTENTKKTFFQSGEDYVNTLFQRMYSLFNKDLAPQRALDFGCGVGRLTRPLAKYCQEVVGLDVSNSMIAEAKRNCQHQNNCHFFLSDDQLSALSGEFDFVHTHLVLQHIHPTQGIPIIEKLLNRVSIGGFVVLHFVYRCNAPAYIRLLVKLRYKVPLLNQLRNLLKGEKITEPPMQMHAYDLGHILNLMRSLGFSSIHQDLDSWGDGIFDVTTVYAQRGAQALKATDRA